MGGVLVLYMCAIVSGITALVTHNLEHDYATVVFVMLAITFIVFGTVYLAAIRTDKYYMKTQDMKDIDQIIKNRFPD